MGRWTNYVASHWLDIDDESGENTTFFRDDVLTQGSALGFRFRFRARVG